MKKAIRLSIPIISVLVLLFSIVGCNSTTSAVDQTADTTASTLAPATKPPTTTTTKPPATTEAPTTTKANKELTLEIINVTSSVSPGEDATLEAKTVPRAECTIEVIYKSGSSRAQGLMPKVADSDGTVSWTWRVGTRTTPGDWPIYVTASSEGKTVTKSTSFTVQ